MRQLIKHCVSHLVLVIGFVATFGLTGCSKDDVTGQCLPDGKCPIIFTATVEGQMYAKAATRATSDNAWVGNEEVAVQIAGTPSTTVLKYIAAKNGTLSAISGVTPPYWQNTTETITVSAWYPYAETRPTSFTVQKFQQGLDYQKSDFIYAAPTDITYSGSKELTFKHLPAKVVVNLKADTQNGVTEAEVKKATVTIVNQSFTSGAISYDGSSGAATVAQVTSGSELIAPKSVATTTDYQKTVQALIVPQMQDKKFFQVNLGKSIYYYTPKNNDANLEAGKQYTYNITVKKNGLTVTLSESGEWTDGGNTNVTGKELASGYKASDLKPGDFYYNDGTWSDGGNRKYSDGSTAVLRDILPVLTNSTTGNPRTVIGIVFWVGDPTTEDAMLGRDHSSCTHGLIMALHEATLPPATTPTKMLWSVNCEEVNKWTNHIDRGSDKVDITETNKLQGYSNTVALKAYNASSNVQNNADLKVLPVVAIEQYNTDYPTPSSSSGWYALSIKELEQMCWGQGNDNTGNNTTSIAGRDMLNTQLGKVGGTKLDGLWSYWSLSETADEATTVWGLEFSHGSLYTFSKNYYENVYWVRALSAF